MGKPFHTSPVIVEAIRSLSQDEGMMDKEIASEIGYNRVSVARIRAQYGIPSYNISNRKDKAFMCPMCGREYLVRRCQSAFVCCPECQKAVNKKITSLMEEAGRAREGGTAG